jgi:hypothetical protein
VSYEVVTVLGRGGTAVVELALDGNGCLVATKRVAVTGSAAQMHVARQRLRREAEILQRLAHPGIVPIIDVVDDGSDVVLVFPAMAESLEDRVTRLGPLSPAEVAGIGHVLLSALATAHRHGVVHRDIKPANVLFDHSGRPALSDFGVAFTREATAGLTPADTAVGTPLWMAPEQARGEPAVPASDVFSLGATLLFAATGQGPYLGGPAMAVIARAGRAEIGPVPAHLPAELRGPLARMLDPRPERRPSAAALLGGPEGTTVTPVQRRPRRASPKRARRALIWLPARLIGDPPERSRRRSRRRRLAVGAILAAVVAGAVVTWFVTAGVGQPQTIPAPHTIGKNCAPGWYNLDGIAADGCEAHSDYVPSMALVEGTPVHANLVPVSASDTFTTHVSGDALNFCWGSLHVTLTAPPRTAEELTIWRGTSKVADAVSTNGSPATATVGKPSCFGADSEDLQIAVTAVVATGGASAADFTLTRDGGW